MSSLINYNQVLIIFQIVYMYKMDVDIQVVNKDKNPYPNFTQTFF